MAARRAPRPTAAAVAVACLAGAVVVTGVARDPQLQRDDWRAAVRSLGPIGEPRLIVATPDVGAHPAALLPAAAAPGGAARVHDGGDRLHRAAGAPAGRAAAAAAAAPAGRAGGGLHARGPHRRRDVHGPALADPACRGPSRSRPRPGLDGKSARCCCRWRGRDRPGANDRLSAAHGQDKVDAPVTFSLGWRGHGLARSRPRRRPRYDYDWLVVGSGFGGSVAAHRLTEKGYRVAVVESGRRFADDEFPRSTWDLRRYFFAPRLGMHGIFRLSLFKTVSILSGAGVGGGSLGYANTLYRARPRFYADPQWAGLEEDWQAALAPHFDEAERMLGVTTVATDDPADDLLREFGRHIGARQDVRQDARRRLLRNARRDRRGPVLRRRRARPHGLHRLRALHGRLPGGREEHARQELPVARRARRLSHPPRARGRRRPPARRARRLRRLQR